MDYSTGKYISLQQMSDTCCHFIVFFSTVLGANTLILMVQDSGYCGFIKASMKLDIFLFCQDQMSLSYAAKGLCSILFLSGGAERESTGSCKVLVYLQCLLSVEAETKVCGTASLWTTPACAVSGQLANHGEEWIYKQLK